MKKDFECTFCGCKKHYNTTILGGCHTKIVDEEKHDIVEGLFNAGCSGGYAHLYYDNYAYACICANCGHIEMFLYADYLKELQKEEKLLKNKLKRIEKEKKILDQKIEDSPKQISNLKLELLSIEKEMELIENTLKDENITIKQQNELNSKKESLIDSRNYNNYHINVIDNEINTLKEKRVSIKKEIAQTKKDLNDL